MKRLSPLLLALLFAAPSSYAVMRVDDAGGVERAHELKAYIQKEKPAFAERESQKKDITDELDHLNADQNGIRTRIGEIQQNQQELVMARDNLGIEFRKQRELEAFEKSRLTALFKVVYKIKRDGLLRFLVYHDANSGLANRIRVLYRSLRAHTVLTRQLEERARRLEESEKRLTKAEEEVSKVLEEMGEQETLLKSLLGKKKDLLKTINHKQNRYQLAVKEYKQVSQQLAALFDDFESQRDENEDPDVRALLPRKDSLPLPIDFGKITRNFGRSVSSKFGTVTYQKGIEIEAEHNEPVKAILPGSVEFEGWVKGLGNVIILHHGGGFYSLSAHLFKTTKTRGVSVAQGDVIGLVGDTGTNDKPSLYFELRENSKAVDPLRYFSQLAVKSLSPAPIPAEVSHVN